MAITKQDVKKQLDYGDGDKSNAPPGRNSRKNACSQSTSNTHSRPTRSQKTVQKPGVVDLEKMSSGSFMNLLGEGASTTTISANQGLKVSRKSDDALKVQMMLNMNDVIIHSDQVDVNEHSDGDDSAANSKEVSLEEKFQAAKSKATDECISKVKEAEVKENTTLQLQAVNVVKGKEVIKTNMQRQPDKAHVNEKEHHVNDKFGHDCVGEQSHTHPDEQSVNQNRASENQDMSSILDATLPLFADTESQTDVCYILCTCLKCKDLVKKFSTYINRGFGEECMNAHDNNAKGMNDSSGRGLSLNSSSQQQDDQFMPLFKGCPINISVTCKGKLKILDKDAKATDRDYVYTIMDDLFEPKVMANMTAAGRTKGSTKMDPKVKDHILVYLQNKFADVNMSDVNEHINSKCYCERRKLWGKDPDQVRKPMVKNVKKLKDSEFENDAENDQNKVKKHKVSASAGVAVKDRSNGKKRHSSVKKSTKRHSEREASESHHRKKFQLKKSDVKARTGSKNHDHHRREKRAVDIKIPYSPFKRPGTLPSKQKKTVRAETGTTDRPKVGGKRPRSMQDILATNKKEQNQFEISASPMKRTKVEHHVDLKRAKSRMGTTTKSPKSKLAYRSEFHEGVPSSTPKPAKSSGSKRNREDEEEKDDDDDDDRNLRSKIQENEELEASERSSDSEVSEREVEDDETGEEEEDVEELKDSERSGSYDTE